MILRSSPILMETLQGSRICVSGRHLPGTDRRRRSFVFCRAVGCGSSSLLRATMLRSKMRPGSFCASQCLILERALDVFT